jgi:hypothetical protein
MMPFASLYPPLIATVIAPQTREPETSVDMVRRGSVGEMCGRVEEHVAEMEIHASSSSTAQQLPSCELAPHLESSQHADSLMHDG